jgi:hypothetical protein
VRASLTNVVVSTGSARRKLTQKEDSLSRVREQAPDDRGGVASSLRELHPRQVLSCTAVVVPDR